MKKKTLSTKALSTIIALAMILTLFAGMTGVAHANPNNIERIAGADRYETSAEAATEAYDAADSVIIARGDDAGDFADGLAASVLAGALDAPIMLTQKDNLPDVVATAIEDLGANEAVILGGEEAIYEEVEYALMAIEGLETVRRIAGDYREETASMIAEEAADVGEIANFAFVVNGRAPADSLAAGPAAFESVAPILQVTQNSIPECTEDAIEELGIEELYVVGGTEVVSSGVLTELAEVADVSRLAGLDRYETSIEVAEEFYPDAIDYSIVGGFNYADAIGAAVYPNPILFVRQDNIPSSVNAYMVDVFTTATKTTIFGGSVAVSQAVADAIRAQIDDLDAPDEITVSNLAQEHYNAGEAMEFTISGLNPNEKATIHFRIFPEGSGQPATFDGKIFTEMTEDDYSEEYDEYSYSGTTDAGGTLEVSGTVAADLPYGELHIIPEGYDEYNIENTIILKSDGVHVTVGSAD